MCAVYTPGGDSRSAGRVVRGIRRWQVMAAALATLARPGPGPSTWSWRRGGGGARGGKKKKSDHVRTFFRGWEAVYGTTAALLFNRVFLVPLIQMAVIGAPCCLLWRVVVFEARSTKHEVATFCVLR
jgi:hypothetical protein